MKLGRPMRWLLCALLLLVAVPLLLVAATIGTIEVGCRGNPQTIAKAVRDPLIAARVPLDLPGYHRPEVVSFLSYPEWSIVHAYEDFAATLTRKDESDFRYLSSIAGFWRSLCRLNQLTAQYPGSYGETKLMLYTIGFSFTAEFAAKGLYENTIGWLAELWRGERKSSVDRYLLQVAEEYARFLQQTPWYAFPFRERLDQLWRVPRVADDSILRHWERRLAVGAEFAVKAGYARLIAAAAGSLGPVDRTTQAVLTLPAQHASLIDGADVVVLQQIDGERVLVRAPRYRAFSEWLARADAAGCQPLEVAGNRRALITALVPWGAMPKAEGVTPLFEVPLSARPELRRVAFDTTVDALPDLLRSIRTTPGARFEHFYDY